MLNAKSEPNFLSETIFVSPTVSPVLKLTTRYQRSSQKERHSGHLFYFIIHITRISIHKFNAKLINNKTNFVFCRINLKAVSFV